MEEQSTQKDRYLRWIFIILALSLILNIVFLASKFNNSEDAHRSDLKYIDPSRENLIDRNVQDASTILHYQGLKEQIEGEIKQYGNEEDVGVFIQDVQTGSWLGINERKGFVPASLLKIPIMMATLKNVERGTLTLQTKIQIEQEDIDQSYQSGIERRAGEEVTVTQLLEDMISYSDNTAKNALKRQVTPEELDSIFKHVGITNPYRAPIDNQTVTSRGYTRLFKALYYSTYLPPEFSQLGLEFATDTSYENMLPAGIPPGVQVAHKFGIYGENPSKALHDCGIVYHEKSPYFICIMTQNIEIEQAADLIRTLSQTTYEFVNEE